MCHKVCVYCQKQLELTESDIDHFYPKALYRHLTFDWNNLLISCATCNRSYKHTYDPGDPPGIIDPTAIDPAHHLEFNIEVAVVDGRELVLAIVDDLTPLGQETVRLFDLNGERGRTQLVKIRNTVIQKLYLIYKKACQGDQEAKEFLRAASDPESEEGFTAFAQTLYAKIPPSS